MTRVIATICARGGSKGVPGKNARRLMGKPLIALAVEQAMRCPAINSGVFVSTDDPHLAEIAATAGASVPFLRPDYLATDSAGKIPVIQHLCRHVMEHEGGFDVVVDLDPTCPLRADSDVEGALAMLTPDTDLVIGCTEARKNPYFNMVENDASGYARLVRHSEDGPVSRQAAPRVFEISGAVYVWHASTLDLGLWGGRVRVFEMPPERSVDIDSEFDFKIVELLAQEMDRNA